MQQTLLQRLSSRKFAGSAAVIGLLYELPTDPLYKSILIVGVAVFYTLCETALDLQGKGETRVDAENIQWFHDNFAAPLNKLSRHIQERG